MSLTPLILNFILKLLIFFINKKSALGFNVIFCINGQEDEFCLHMLKV